MIHATKTIIPIVVTCLWVGYICLIIYIEMVVIPWIFNTTLEALVVAVVLAVIPVVIIALWFEYKNRK